MQEHPGTKCRLLLLRAASVVVRMPLAVLRATYRFCNACLISGNNPAPASGLPHNPLSTALA